MSETQAVAVEEPKPEAQAAEQPKPDIPQRGFIAEWTVTILLLLFGTTTLVQAFVIPTGSMEDSLLIGDHLLVDKLAYAPAGSLAKYVLPYQEVERGDMVCLYTGFADVLLEMKKKPDPQLVNNTCTGLDGRDEKLLQWIGDSGLAYLLADNYAVELIATGLTDPLPRRQAWLPLHEYCLFKNGIHLGELWYFSELARWLREHRRSRFLLTAPPLRLPGAVGSPATPIATV